MLIELDTLLAILALLSLLPVTIFQILHAQSVFSSLSGRFSERLALDSAAQKLEFQLGSLSWQQANYSYLLNGSEYILLPYGSSTANSAQSAPVSRIAVVAGKLYILVKK